MCRLRMSEWCLYQIYNTFHTFIECVREFRVNKIIEICYVAFVDVDLIIQRMEMERTGHQALETISKRQ